MGEKKNFIGIDEAGRGAWAGPLVVAGIQSEDPYCFDHLYGLDDSKKLSPKSREVLYRKIISLSKQRNIRIFLDIRSAHMIDTYGISGVCRQAFEQMLSRHMNRKSMVLIDGADNYIFDTVDAHYLFAKKQSRTQKTRERLPSQEDIYTASQVARATIRYQIRGDSLIPLISAASIIAKVTRDFLLCQLATIYPLYAFESHKGYGTARHRASLVYYGTTSIHRKSYAPMKGLISSGKGI